MYEVPPIKSKINCLKIFFTKTYFSFLLNSNLGNCVCLYGEITDTGTYTLSDDFANYSHILIHWGHISGTKVILIPTKNSNVVNSSLYDGFFDTPITSWNTFIHYHFLETNKIDVLQLKSTGWLKPKIFGIYGVK